MTNLYKRLILNIKLVHPARFELTTSAFGGQRSIQLSYGCLGRNIADVGCSCKPLVWLKTRRRP